MTQHFLLTAAARSLSLASVARMSEEEAREAFKAIRWSDNKGQPYCARCGCASVCVYSNGLHWRCKSCRYRFSVTAGTIFASRKLPIRDYLLAIAIFVNGAKGHSALQLSRDLDCQYKTAFVLAHKIREAMAAEMTGRTVKGEVEVDGAYFGGYIKPANFKSHRRDRRTAAVSNGKRRCVVIMRERYGRTLPFVFRSEDAALPTIGERVEPGSVVYADDAAHWNSLHAKYLTHRVNHSYAYSHDGACTNMAESFFSRLRRAEIGIHHHFAGPYLNAYADEMAWREDGRRNSNGVQYLAVIDAASKHPVSEKWCGYWQRAWHAAG
jgi:transposase-like protein